MTELEVIVGDVVKEWLAEDAEDADLEARTEAAAEEQEALSSAQKSSSASSSAAASASSSASGTVDPPLATPSAFDALLASHNLVDVSTHVMKFADASNPSVVVGSIPCVTWASGKVSLQAICRRKHGKAGSCAVWFNNVEEKDKYRIICACLKWFKEGATMSEDQHWGAGRRLKKSIS